MTALVDFSVRQNDIDGLLVVTMKQVTDGRGTVREMFRRSAFEDAGVEVPEFRQINLTETRQGAVRGLHAEAMTKLVTVGAGEVFAAFVDLRPRSATRGEVATFPLVPGVEVLVPAGVANGFQCVTETSQYVYCFDREWTPGMPGQSVNPLDPDLSIAWPLPIDPDDATQISVKDRDAPALADVLAAGDRA